MGAWGNAIGRGRVAGIESGLRHSSAGVVAVGYHADQLVVLSNRNGTDVMLAHQFREFDNRGVRTDPINALVHRVFDFHGGTSVAEAWLHSLKCSAGPPLFQLYNGSGPCTRAPRSRD